jgi:hypothetical protein
MGTIRTTNVASNAIKARTFCLSTINWNGNDALTFHDAVLTSPDKSDLSSNSDRLRRKSIYCSIQNYWYLTTRLLFSGNILKSSKSSNLPIRKWCNESLRGTLDSLLITKRRTYPHSWFYLFSRIIIINL